MSVFKYHWTEPDGTRVKSDDPRPQPKGDPLIIVMQLEEISEKLNLILESLKRIEALLERPAQEPRNYGGPPL